VDPGLPVVGGSDRGTVFLSVCAFPRPDERLNVIGAWGGNAQGRVIVPEQRSTNGPLGLCPTSFRCVLDAPALDVRYDLVVPVGRMAEVCVPHRALLAILLLPVLPPLARSRLRRPGRCRTSGYDLHATPERCLECGTPATTEGAGL
jgi:hypothetical protein